ncbi:hypothetical protein MKW92_034488 [Papaver armeniacum]|nr:hypothetical protein MKW92_034488 [Papaver armeniacum]
MTDIWLVRFDFENSLCLFSKRVVWSEFYLEVGARNETTLLLGLQIMSRMLSVLLINVKSLTSKSASSIIEAVLRRDPNESEFIQSVQEAIHSLERVIAKNTHYVRILERLLEPERMLPILGPCRGGLRFNPSMNLSVAKFLGFEQVCICNSKNALSPYKLGGAGGGSDFDPKGKSENEIMRFCQSFMQELHRYLGPNQKTWVLGPREMGFLFGQYRRLAGSFTGARIFLSGSSHSNRATSYGLVYFAQLMLAEMNKELKGLRCVVSGSGKLQCMLDKLVAFGAYSRGYLVDEDGFDYMKVAFVRDIKVQQRSLRVLKTYTDQVLRGCKTWNERCDLACLCAAQNEIGQADAVNLVSSGCRILIEAVDVLRKANVLVAPAKAAGAGGEAMKSTYQRTSKAAADFGYSKECPDFSVCGQHRFLTLAQAMTEQGCV